MNIRNILVSLVLALISQMSFAATYYGSKDQCEAAWRAGKAVGYKPTAKHKDFSDARIAGLEKRPLEGDACVFLGAQPGKRWVFLKQGTEVYTKGTKVTFLAECQNDIFESVYLKKDESAVDSPAATAGCGSDGCGNVTVNQTITHVVTEVKVCKSHDGKEFPAVNGECKFAPTKVLVSAKVEAPTSEVACSGNCSKPKVEVTRKVTRTDGRCVLVLEHEGTEHFVRFDTKGDRLLVAARVSDAIGDWVRTNPLGLVGDDKQTVKLDAANQCSAAIAAFTSERSFAPTAKRIGLDTRCKSKGQV